VTQFYCTLYYCTINAFDNDAIKDSTYLLTYLLSQITVLPYCIARFICVTGSVETLVK